MIYGNEQEETSTVFKNFDRIKEMDSIIDYSIIVRFNGIMKNNNKSISIHAYEGSNYENYLKSMGLKYEDTFNNGILLSANPSVKEGEILNIIINEKEYKIPIIKTTNLDPEVAIFDLDNSKIEKIDSDSLEYERLIISNDMAKKIDINDEIVKGRFSMDMRVNSSNPNKLEKEIEQFVNLDKIAITNYTKQKEYEGKFSAIMSIFLYGLLLVISLIGVTNIYNTITANVHLRKKELEVLKAIGMSNKQFTKMFAYESLIYGAKSLLIGIILGIIFITILFLVTCMLSLFTTVKAATGSMYLNIKLLRNSGYGYKLASNNKNVWKIYETDGNGNDKGLNSTIYCLKGGPGFGSSDYVSGTPQETHYTQYFNLKDPNSITPNQYKNVLPDTSSKEYKALLWILDNCYVAPKTNPTTEEANRAVQDKKNLLNAAAAYAEEVSNTDVTINELNLLTDDDIDAVQQIAVWYYTNPEGDSYHVTSIDFWLNSVQGTENSTFKSMINFGDDGWDRANACQALFDYLVQTPQKADFTYTFSYKKNGLLLWPGCDYCGLVKVVPIGIDDHSFCGNLPSVRALDESDLKKLDNRPAHSNKGTFGKLLVIAGSRNMAGAAVLSAKAAYKSGAGLVKIITPECNRSIIQCALPEALLCTDIASAKALETELDWADAVVIGPGLSKSDNAKMLVETVLKTAEIPLVIDADALNIISDNMTLLNEHKMPVIVTPHLGEMSRLMKKSIANIQEDIIGMAGEFACLYNVTCVLKDFRTIIAAADGEKFINLSGNCGMATAGSGDVLSGIVGGLLVQWRDTKKAAAYGAFIHGLAGDMVFDNTGSYGMIASDIIDGLDKVWIKVEKNGN